MYIKLLCHRIFREEFEDLSCITDDSKFVFGQEETVSSGSKFIYSYNSGFFRISREEFKDLSCITDDSEFVFGQEETAFSVEVESPNKPMTVKASTGLLQDLYTVC